MANPNINIDLNEWFERAQDQFRGLNPNEPGQWPLLPKIASFLAAACVVVFLGWYLFISDQAEQLQMERDREVQLKNDHRAKVVQAVNLDELRKQLVQVGEYVQQLEKQLPGKAEMAALLSDINQAGLGRGLDFDLFRPGQVLVKEYYAELPINIRVTGRYHDIGAFTGDIANLSRIVTLHNLDVGFTGNKDNTGALYMEAVARTYRYLDPAEVEQARAEESKKAGGKK